MARDLSEKLRVSIEWIASHPVAATHDAFDLTNYFESSQSTDTYDKLAIATPFRVAASKLLPKQSFHQIVTRRLPGLQEERARVPYPSVTLTKHFTGEVAAISAFLFKGQILVTRVRAGLEVDTHAGLEGALSSLGEIRSPKEVPVAKGLIQGIANAVQGRPRNPASKVSFDHYFALRIRLPHNARELDELVVELRKPLVALLVGTHHPSMLNDEVVEKVWESNRELNVKAAGELLLLNRQGLIYVVPQGRYQGPNRERFDRTRDLAILANYARTFLREGHTFQGEDSVASQDIVRKVEQWVQQPSTTFDASVTQTLSWEALVREFDLHRRLEAWNRYFDPS